MGKILIVGVGNTIMRDDGIGVHALNALRSRNLPEYVDTVEAGTALLDVFPDLQEYEKVILLDAIESNEDSVVVIRDPLPSRAADQRLSLHEIGIEEALSLALLSNGGLPQVVIMGVTPERIELGTELSDEVAPRIPELVDAVMDEINGGTISAFG